MIPLVSVKHDGVLSLVVECFLDESGILASG